MEENNSFIKYVSDKRRACRLYFSEGESDIAQTNLTTLFGASLVCSVLVITLMLLTPLIMRNWTPTVQHILFAPVTLLFALIARAVQRKVQPSYTLVNGLCIAFIACVFGFAISLDIYPYLDKPASFMPIVLIALPSLFILRRRWVYSEILLIEAFYVWQLFSWKEIHMARCDCFNSIAALAVSLGMSEIMLNLRAASYNSKSQYKHMSMTDGLTGILNKLNCEQAVRSYIEMRSEAENCALLIIDIDDFKHTNDSKGHKFGDNVLENVGEMLLKTFRNSDVLGRFGGDEFLVLMRNLPGIEIVERKCLQLSDGMREMSFNMHVSLSLSVGVSYLDNENVSYEKLFEVADDALYEAKITGKSRCAVHRVHAVAAQTRAKPIMLIADDNQMNRTIFKASFEDEFDVLQAESGVKTLEIINEYRDALKIVLLDLMMPDVDGYEILKYMKTRSRISKIPVVVITADSKSEKDVLQLGAADMITKPFDAEITKLRVMNAVRMKNCSN